MDITTAGSGKKLDVDKLIEEQIVAEAKSDSLTQEQIAMLDISRILKEISDKVNIMQRRANELVEELKTVQSTLRCLSDTQTALTALIARKVQ